MSQVELKKGNIKTSSRDLYWQKSHIEFVPLEHPLLELIIITSYDYASTELGIDAFKEQDKLKSWINEQSEKFFEEFKQNQDKFTNQKRIIRIFSNLQFSNLDNFFETIENETSFYY